MSKYKPKNDNMYSNAVIYDDLHDLLAKGIIKKEGNPSGWDDTSHRTNPWNSKLMINIDKGPQ